MGEEKVLQYYWKIRGISKSLSDEVAEVFNVNYYDCPAEFFSMAFNKCTYAIESVDFYHNTWKKINYSSSNGNQLKQENGERIIHIERSTFIEIFSAFEYSIKAAVLSFPSNFPPEQTKEFEERHDKNSLYISGILEQCNKYGFINQQTLELWKGLTKFRNTLVHNNGISSMTKTYSYGTFDIEFKKHSMISSDLLMICQATEWMLNQARSLLFSCLKKPA